MYCIAVLTDNEHNGPGYAECIKKYCTSKDIFPLVEIYQDVESFFRKIQGTVPDLVLLVLPEVSGLNNVVHLRSLYPGCGIIWCSDLDFSLQAFRLRVEYFFLEPIEEEKIQEGLQLWMERCKGMGKG